MPYPYGGTIGAAAHGTGAIRAITAIVDGGSVTGYVYQTIGSEFYRVKINDDGTHDLPARIGSLSDALPDDGAGKSYACAAPTPASRSRTRSLCTSMRETAKEKEAAAAA